jgi:predicted dehydrogenase
MTSSGGGGSYGIAIVGCGQIVTHHIEAIYSLSTELFHVVALCDPSSERRHILEQQIQDARRLSSSNSKHPIHQFDSLDELLQQDTTPFLLSHIDFIFIAVPHDLHEALTLLALERTTTQHIVLEKPLAPTRESCDRLLQASVDYQRRLIVAEQSPYWPAVVKAQSLLYEEQAIGSILSIASYYYESMRDNVTSGSIDAATGGLGWRGSLQRAGGGIAIDGGLHWIRPVAELARARIRSVVGVTCPVPSVQQALAMEGESLAHALFELEPPPASDTAAVTPLIATYSCCLLANPAPMAHDACPYLRITGTAGELVLAGTGLQKDVPGAGGLRLANADHPQGRNVFSDDEPSHFFLAFRGLWQEIYRIRREKDHAAAQETVRKAADDVRVVLALYQSSKTRCWEQT